MPRSGGLAESEGARDCHVSICQPTGKEALSGAHPQGDEELCLAKRELVAQVEYTEFTEDGHLRYTKFCGFRDNKESHRVLRE